jgi:lauroyl/myristoyl acyltransferase
LAENRVIMLMGDEFGGALNGGQPVRFLGQRAYPPLFLDVFLRRKPDVPVVIAVMERRRGSRYRFRAERFIRIEPKRDAAAVLGRLGEICGESPEHYYEWRELDRINGDQFA